MLERVRSSQAMLVSVVIPAYNAADYLAEAIDSVLSQSHTELELIVVDDGSTDATPAVAGRYESDPRVTVLRTGNRGVSAARNLGLERATGDWVAFLDADDRWAPEKLDAQLAVVGSRADVAAVGTYMDFIAPDGRKLGVAGEQVVDGDLERVAAGELMPVPLSSLLFSRAALAAVGGFDPAMDALRPAQVEDLDLVARIVRVGQLEIIARPLGGYRIHDRSATSRHPLGQYQARRFLRERLAARARGEDLSWEDFLANSRPTLRDRHGDFVRSRYRAAAVSRAEGHTARAMVHLVGAVLVGPRYTFNWLRAQGRSRRSAS